MWSSYASQLGLLQFNLKAPIIFQKQCMSHIIRTIFIDLTKAFDLVTQTLSSEILADLGLSSDPVKWFSFCLVLPT